MITKALNKYDKIIFDCDGVIFDTNQSKVSIFMDSVSEFPTKSKRLFKDFLNRNFGRSREYIFQHFLNEIENDSLNNLPVLLNRYSKMCVKMYKEKSFTEGFEEIINKTIQTPKIILSGNNQKELEEVFKEKNYFDFFDKILGSPINKETHLKQLKYNNSEKIIFLGDSSYDLKVAEMFNIDFLFVSKYSIKPDQSIFKNKISTLADIL